MGPQAKTDEMIHANRVEVINLMNRKKFKGFNGNETSPDINVLFERFELVLKKWCKQEM